MNKQKGNIKGTNGASIQIEEKQNHEIQEHEEDGEIEKLTTAWAEKNEGRYHGEAAAEGGEEEETEQMKIEEKGMKKSTEKEQKKAVNGRKKKGERGKEVIKTRGTKQPCKPPASKK